jgi:hypothetical protein
MDREIRAKGCAEDGEAHANMDREVSAKGCAEVEGSTCKHG